MVDLSMKWKGTLTNSANDGGGRGCASGEADVINGKVFPYHS